MNKKLALFALLCAGFSFASVRAAVSFNGQDYTPVADWARANKLDCHWLKRDDLLEATNRTTRLVFDVDSHYVEINGVQVALSFPVANQKGAALVAQFDLDHTIRPLLSPSRYVKPAVIKTICLDPGHGGKDTGNRVGWHDEKTYTLRLALELSKQLEQAGFRVMLTRTRDTTVELPDRPALANKRRADLFVSLHFNATQAGRDQVEGPETYCITPVGASSTNARGEGSDRGPTPANRDEDASLLFAYQIEKSLVENLKAEDRGVRRARFAVLRDAKMPAILIEGGYMTHPVEGKKIYSSAYRRQMAQAIVKGILAYQKLTSPPPAATPATGHHPAKPAANLPQNIQRMEENSRP
ncbi:MAG: N-acetylmuramoyl-L-alanine amidase [Verrucomicrobiia bacterium]